MLHAMNPWPMPMIRGPRARARRRSAAAIAVLAGALPLLSCSDPVTGPSDLEGGPWRLESMEPAGAARFVPDDPGRFTVEFRSDGKIAVVADCNGCGGGYSVNGGILTVPALACTLIACAGPEGGQFAGLIEGMSSIQKDGNELQIASPEGKLTLRQ
jgi:heat shock protein HslJ